MEDEISFDDIGNSIRCLFKCRCGDGAMSTFRSIGFHKMYLVETLKATKVGNIIFFRGLSLCHR